MAKKPTKSTPAKQVADLTHGGAKRKNIPTVEHQSVMQQYERAPIKVKYPRGGNGLDAEKAQRNPDLDPQLVWRGKDQQDWSDLVVNAPPLYIQEKVKPKVLIDDLRRMSGQAVSPQAGDMADLFGDFNGLPEGADKTEFYQHEGHWQNRMILGDSLQVMASLAEREGLRGKVQCIYFDPPYGIKFNSNFQWSTTSRDVKDGNADHITREPEQVKAFRDTWKDGIHSYLTYLRDRLMVARDLLTESGSIFVQIGEENVHRVRAVLDEVFGDANFVSQINFKTTGGAGSPTGGTETLASVNNFILWYAKNGSVIKYRQLFRVKGEAAEALLELATGGMPVVPQPIGMTDDPFQHPDAQRRFRVMSDVEELQRALEYPWDKWTVFLHPAQRQMVERDYNGPARVSGSAGTGKTVVALHRAVHLARKDEDARILLTTFSDTLANVLRSQLIRLTWGTPKLAERIDVAAMDTVGSRLYSVEFGKPVFASREEISSLLQSAAKLVDGVRSSPVFLLSEWEDTVDAWQLDSWGTYRDAKRLGRKVRLPEAQRALLWQVFTRVRGELEQAGKITMAEMFSRLADAMSRRKHPVFDYVVVDEAQDIGVQQLRFLASIAGSRPNALFFAGDLGQRIFQLPFSWKSLGVDVRGRSRTLHINYRTSHQIRSQADRLLSSDVSDVDGNVETRKGTISVFNGPEPIIRSFGSPDLESHAVGQWLKQCVAHGVLPQEIGVFVRSEAELPRAQAAVKAAGLQGRVLGRDMATEEDFVSITTMHLAKGMEFRTVAVMACDDEVIPSQARIESAADEVDLTEIYDTERHLLYVACTRARDSLHVSAVSPASEFLEDLLIS